MDPVAAVFIALGVVLLVFLFFWQTIYVVQQAEAILIERLGTFNRVLQPGINFVWPFIEAPKQFTWKKTYISAGGSVIDESKTMIRVDLRENVFNFPRQKVYTKDTVEMTVNAVMYFKISDIHKAVYEVDDLTSAVQNVAQTQLKEVFGGMQMTVALQSQTAINEHMRRNFEAVFTQWGLEVLRIELLDLTPLAHSQTAMAMKEQMKAERRRRADFIIAEGDKSAMRLESEGEKLKKTNLGVAQQEATRKTSEGEATAKIELARAETAALEAIADAVAADGCSQTEFALFQKYNDFLRDVTSGVASKTLYLPYETSNITGLLRRLPGVYGHASTGGTVAPPARVGGVAAAGRRGGARGTGHDDSALN